MQKKKNSQFDPTLSNAKRRTAEQREVERFLKAGYRMSGFGDHYMFVASGLGLVY